MNGTEFRALREALRISLPTMASSIGMSPTSISLHERGQLSLTDEHSASAHRVFVESAEEAAKALAAVRYMGLNHCELVLAVNDADERDVEWEVTQTLRNPAYSGFGTTIVEAVFDAMKQNGGSALCE